MQAFTNLSSRVIALDLNDVDTDLIIPAQYLTSVSREGYGQNLFRRLKDSDASFPMNLVEYQGAQILLSARNFGCGSSREAAVWALQGAGIRVVIAESFADIFSSNCAKNGLLLITLPGDVIETLLNASKTNALTLSVNLDSQTVTAAEQSWLFDYDQFRKHCLLNGLDDLDYIRSHSKQVNDYFNQTKSFLKL